MEPKSGSPSRLRVLGTTLIITAVLLLGSSGLSRKAHADIERATATAIAHRTVTAGATEVARVTAATEEAASSEATVVARRTATAVQATIVALTPSPTPDLPDPTFVAQTNLLSLLPTAVDLEVDLKRSTTTGRTLREVSRNYSDPAATRAKFEELGWEENVIREFEPSLEADVPDENPNYISTSIHRFQSANSAMLALDFAINDEPSVNEEFAVVLPGTKSRGIAGTYDDGERHAKIYVQLGETLVIGYAESSKGDPFPSAISAVQAVLRRASP